MNSTADTRVPLSPHPIVAFTGPFGVGKTEVALNYALAALARGRAACLVDLDIVTPYQRAGEYRGRLAGSGLRVIASPGALTSFELPALSPEIAATLRREDAHIVLDAGGDPVGAAILGVYASEIAARAHDIWLVANPFRPSASSPQIIADQARAIEATSHLSLTGIVANPNLGPFTEPAHIRAGLEQVRRSADLLALPIVFLAVDPSVLNLATTSGLPILALRRLLQYPWEGE